MIEFAESLAMSVNAAVAPRASSYAGPYLQRLREVGAIGWMGRGETLCSEGESSSHVYVLASGFVVAIKRTAAGLQQNVALYVPGDIINHESFTLGASRCCAAALTPVTFHKVGHESLRSIHESSDHHAESFRRYVAFSGALAQDWLLRLGRQSAYARTAHFLCEIIHRTGAGVGGSPISCGMPLTQTELADTLGLSVVHVNRTLMRLRQENLIRLRRGYIDVLDWPRFKSAAGFEPAYLDRMA